MNVEALKETIRQELPGLLRDDPVLRAYILELSRQEYAGKVETQDRFYELLGELRRDREEQTRKWDEQTRKWNEETRKWDEQSRKWDEQSRKWDEQTRKWDEQVLDREEQNRKWDEQNRKWDEQNRKWDEQARQWEIHQTDLRKEFKQIHEEIMAQARRHESSIGALGARWGLQSEKAFRDGLAAILEKTFDVRVLRVNEYDHEGEVFGRPDQVELDVIVRNGMLIICELKSSVDKAGMYIFERKARFYEKHHQRQANRLMVISPMIDGRAKQVAEKLGIETYGYSTDVEDL
jgi:hypothetical protein